MNGLDLVLLALAGLAALGGWRLGFLRRFSGWVGVGAGLAVGIVFVPPLVERLNLSSELSVLLAVTSLLVLLASLGQGIGALIGARLQQEVESPVARGVDAVGGTLLGVLAVFAMAWLLLPVMAEADGWSSASTRGSALAAIIDKHLPDPPAQIQDLERQLVRGGYPQLFTDLRRTPEIPPAPPNSPVSQQMVDTVSSSVVRLQSDACDQRQSGSGFFIDERLIATNAHVVAGADRIEISTPDGERTDGTVVAFDPEVDLALVRTDLTRQPLHLAPPSVGDEGLVLGFPGGGPFAPSPFRVGELLDARGFDIYDEGTVERKIMALSAALEPGDSGSAVLRSDGAVVGVAVAVAPDRADVAYALDSGELENLLARASEGRVDTGRCTA